MSGWIWFLRQFHSLLRSFLESQVFFQKELSTKVHSLAKLSTDHSSIAHPTLGRQKPPLCPSNGKDQKKLKQEKKVFNLWRVLNTFAMFWLFDSYCTQPVVLLLSLSNSLASRKIHSSLSSLKSPACHQWWNNPYHPFMIYLSLYTFTP